ncbi:MAG TPA: NAD(P)/FAD-dependent oxidoreductase [Methanomassiliicoccales archaeon]
MEVKKCDVLVVGSGPAGSGAGRAAAESGAKTIVIDRKKEIGTPVQCGEVIGRSVLAMTDIRIPRYARCCEQEFTRFIVDRTVQIDNHEDYWRSLTVERKLFDKYLAEKAARGGASVQSDARLLDIETEGEGIASCSLMVRGEKVAVEPKIVIAADGVHSSVGKLMGKELFPSGSVARGVEYEMVSKKRLPPCMQIFIEPEIGLGYGWIIPKGSHRANVGLGFVGGTESRKDVLTDWIVSNPIVAQYFDPEKILEVKTGDAPVPGFLGGPSSGNVLFAGDAAGQTLAFVGEGIMPSYICGTVAGRVAAAAVNDRAALDRYDTEIKAVLGEELEKGAELRDLLFTIWTESDMNNVQRAVVSAFIMNEMISLNDLESIERLANEGGPAVAREIRLRGRAAHKRIKASSLPNPR